jgi:iron complex outermembrane receptor protein
MTMKKIFTMVPMVCAISMLTVDATAAQLEEVVVTARKREESLQETPISVMSFGGQALDSQNVADLKGLDMKLPNVAIGGSGGLGGTNAAFYVRGIGTSRNAVNQESAVALYVDDAYYGRSDGAILSVLDVASIEVLRGPQGTLFGRSATAGAMRYITNKPIYEELEGKIELNYGSENKKDLKGVLNVPLSDNTALRLTAATLNQDGHVDGFFTGKDYGDVNTDMVRGYFGWQASDTLEVLATADYTRMDNNGSPSILLDRNTTTNPVVAGEAALGFDIGTLPLGDFDTSYQTGNNFYESDNIGLGLVINWALNEQIDVKSSTNWREVDLEGGYDTDGTHAILFDQTPYERDLEMFSQELQLSGMTDSTNWIAGIFYYSEESSERRLAATGHPGNPFIGLTNTRFTAPYEVESFALFGQSTFDINEAWSVTAGMRYTKDDKSIVADELNVLGESKLADGPVERDESWSAFSGRISLEWQMAEDVFVFGSYARGFRAGGFNDRIRTNLPDAHFGITDFDEEILDMYELGVRSELFDNQLRLNLTAFYGEFTDMQITTLIPGSNRAVITNAGEAEISGIEGEFTWAINDNFALNGTLGLMDAEYTQLNANVVSVTKDSDFGRAPDLSYSLGLEADYDIIVARIDYGWKDDFGLVEAPDSAVIVQESYGLLSANVRYQPENTSWNISVYGTNLTDEEYLVSGISLLGNGEPGVAQGEPGRFREFGVKFGWEF